MKISDIEVIEFRTTTRVRPSRWAYGVWSDRQTETSATITRISTDEGICGHMLGGDKATMEGPIKNMLVGENPLNREKLWTSLTKACAKRPLAIGTIEKVVADIESNLANSGRAEISSRIIGEMVMERLKDLDRVAYIRYASVYRDFRDIESFKEEIEALLEPREPEGVPSNQLSFLEEETVPTPPRRRRGRRPRPPQPEQA